MKDGVRWFTDEELQHIEGRSDEAGHLAAHLRATRAEAERLQAALRSLERAASEVSNHERLPGFRRTQRQWTMLYNAVAWARSALEGEHE